MEGRNSVKNTKNKIETIDNDELFFHILSIRRPHQKQAIANSSLVGIIDGMWKISLYRFFKNHLPQVIYGAVDGTVTTFAVVAWATGGNLAHSTIIILGLANLFADGVSMSISAYLSARSEKFQQKSPMKIAIWTLVSFIIIGFIPIIPYVFRIGTFFVSCVMTAITFIGIGVLKGYVLRTSLLFSALQTLWLGTVAAMIAYYVWAFLAGM